MKFALVSRSLVVSALLALLAVSPVTGAAGKARKPTCKGGKVPVTVAKKTTCKPLGKAIPKPKAIDLRLADLQQALKFDPAKALHGKKRKGARTLQSGFGAAGKMAQKKLLKVLPKALAFIDRRGGGARSSRLPAAGPALASSGCEVGPAGPTGQTGGATMGTLGDNGGYIDAPAGGGLRVRVTFVSCGGVSHFHIADCPTATGSVDAAGSGEFRATIEIWDRGRLVSRNSTTFEEKAKAHGEVGADAKLKFIDVEHTQEVFIVASGGIVVRGGVTRNVRIDMPGGGYDSAGAGVHFFGDPISGDSGAGSFASTAKAAITSYRGAEPRWSTFNPPGGYCAEPVFTPESNTLKLKKGDKKQLGIYAKARQDGGRASGARWTLLDPDNADFLPSSSQDPAPTVSYTVTNASKGNQVKVTVKFTSTAGVGEKSWTQPIEGGIQHISGTFSGHWEGPSYEGGPNYHYQFTGTASFDRRPTGTYPALFDLVSGTISESFTGVTAPDDYHQPACKVAGHAERVLKPSPDNYFELAGSGSSHSDPPFAHLIFLIDSTGEGEATYSECKYDFDEGTDSWSGNYYGEVFTGYGPDEFTFTGSLGAPEGEGEQTWSFTGTP